MRPLNAALKKSLAESAAEHEQNIDLAKDYLLARGIDHASAVRFRLGVVSESATHNPDMAGRLCIPSIGMDDGVYNVRFRTMNDEKPKYKGLSGFETRLFNNRAFTSAVDTIHITEGELDAVVLEKLGYPAVGVCGANAWKRHHPRMFAGFTRVYVWGDGDDAGQQFAGKVTGSLLSAVRVTMSPGQDVTDLYLTEGEAGIRKALGMDD